MGAYKYAELINRLLNSCEYLDPRPVIPSKIVIPKSNTNALKWIEGFTFRENKVLSVKDIALFDSDGRMLERGFHYDFREQDGIDPIFRICNHGKVRPASDPCHVHVGTKEIPLFEHSLDATFAYAMRCIKHFYMHTPQDWNEGGMYE